MGSLIHYRFMAASKVLGEETVVGAAGASAAGSGSGSAQRGEGSE